MLWKLWNRVNLLNEEQKNRKADALMSQEKHHNHARVRDVVCTYLTSADVPEAATFERPVSCARERNDDVPGTGPQE